MSGRRSAGFGRLGPWSARQALLAMYGDDEAVGRDLVALHDEHYRTPWRFELVYVRLATRRDHEGEYVYPAGPAAEALLAALGALVDRCGMARLGRDDAMAWVHRWALLRAELGEGVAPDQIVSSLGLSYGVPDSSEPVSWRPDLESRADAMERGRKLGVPRRIVRAGLRADRERWQAAGWDFPDAMPEAERQLRWLYLRLRHGWTYAEIARREGLAEAHLYTEPAKAVQQAVRRLARAADADVSRGR